MKKGSEYTMDNVKMLCEHYDTQVVRVEDDKDATFFKEAFLHLFKKTSKGAAKRRYDLALIYLSANETTGVAGEGWCNFLTVFLNGSAKLETLPCSDKEFGNKSLTNSHICWRTNTVGDDDMSPQEKVNIKINGEKSTASVGEEQLETTVYGILETETTTQNSTTEPPSPPLKPVWKVVLAMGIGILTIYSTSALVLVYLTEEKLYYERQLAVQLVENKPEQ